MFNPILMKFTDAKVEQLKKQQEGAMNIHRLNVAKDKQLCYEQKFDIVSHKSHLKGLEKSLAATLRDTPKISDSRVTYNIVSHHQKSVHPELSIIPLDVTPRQEQPRIHPAITAMGNELPRSHAQRPFDVISNRYLEEHDKKISDDLLVLRKEAQLRYWQTHNYDPVVGRYYDSSKEGEYKRQVKALDEVHGSCQQARLPPSIQFSEGQAYNVVTMTCKDQGKLSTAVENANRAVASKKGALIEMGIRKRAEDAADLAAERRLERIGRTGVLRAQMDGRHHGYDPITNEKHHGRGSKPLAPSRLRPPETVWSKLHSDTTLSQTGAFGSMGTAVQPLAKVRDLTGAPAAAATNPSATIASSATAAASAAAIDYPPATAAASTVKRDGSNHSAILPMPPSARLSARSINSHSARSARQRMGGGRTNAPGGRTGPVVPALKMPSNITALQNNTN